MKAQWLKLSARIDAMSLRERIAVFVALAASIIFLINAAVLEPLIARNKLLAGQIKAQQNQMQAADAGITAVMAAYAANPDQANELRKAELSKEIGQMAGALRTMQHGLVAPEKMSQLIQQLVRSNGKLKLLSLRTLPVGGVNASTGVEAPAGAAAPAAAGKPAAQKELLYRHGVELVLQGGYLDMLEYMEALEGLPTQLFWGKAQLDARAYPTAKLTLTLYTLSLDDKWMTL